MDGTSKHVACNIIVFHTRESKRVVVFRVGFENTFFQNILVVG